MQVWAAAVAEEAGEAAAAGDAGAPVTLADPDSPVHGRDPAELAARLHPGGWAERRVDLFLRLGAYGDGFGTRPPGFAPARTPASRSLRHSVIWEENRPSDRRYAPPCWVWHAAS